MYTHFSLSLKHVYPNVIGCDSLKSTEIDK